MECKVVGIPGACGEDAHLGTWGTGVKTVAVLHVEGGRPAR